MPAIDLNADLGEALGQDDAMLGIATSAHVSCGMHAGAPLTSPRTVANTADGTLAPRSQPGSVLHDPDAAVGQALSIATQGWARTVDAGVTLAPFAP